MKNIFFVSCFSLLISYSALAQIVVFHPVTVPADEIEKFLSIETSFSQKTAQTAVNNGDLSGWALFERFNPGPEEANFMWVNVYPDIETAVNKGAWWNNSKQVHGIDTAILYDYGKNMVNDKRYYYEMQLEIDGTAAPAYVIFNFASPEDVDKVVMTSKKYVQPHFIKKMNNNGMVGWGLATKITPQGEDYSSIVYYDAYDKLENVMHHLAGRGVMEGLPQDKITPVKWEMRPIMKVIAMTQPKQ